MRTRVLEAVAGLIAAGDDVTFAKAAAAAGVPERTVYRYFPNRQVLIAGLFEHTNRQVGFDGDLPTTPAAMVAMVQRVFPGFDTVAPVVAELLASPDGRAARLAAAGERRTAALAVVERARPDLPPDEARHVAAVVQVLGTAADLAGAARLLGPRRHRGGRGRHDGPATAAHRPPPPQGGADGPARRRQPRRRAHRRSRPLRRVLRACSASTSSSPRTPPPSATPSCAPARPRGCTRPRSSAAPTARRRRRCSIVGTSITSRSRRRRRRRSPRIRERLRERGASTGEIDDLGAFHSVWFDDPDGMRAEVVLIVDDSLAGIHAPRPLEPALR